MNIIKRICIITEDENGREIERKYHYFDGEESKSNATKTFCGWLRGELYDLTWMFDYPEYEDDVNRHAWIEDVNADNGCIKANYQLF